MEKKNIKDSVLLAYHALHEIVEITHGIIENFEIGFYLFTNYTGTNGFKVVGSHIRPVFVYTKNGIVRQG